MKKLVNVSTGAEDSESDSDIFITQSSTKPVEKTDSDCQMTSIQKRITPFTEKEDLNLIKGINKHGYGKWGKILSDPSLCAILYIIKCWAGLFPIKFDKAFNSCYNDIENTGQSTWERGQKPWISLQTYGWQPSPMIYELSLLTVVTTISRTPAHQQRGQKP